MSVLFQVCKMWGHLLNLLPMGLLYHIPLAIPKFLFGHLEILCNPNAVLTIWKQKLKFLVNFSKSKTLTFQAWRLRNGVQILFMETSEISNIDIFDRWAGCRACVLCQGISFSCVLRCWDFVLWVILVSREQKLSKPHLQIWLFTWKGGEWSCVLFIVVSSTRNIVDNC